MFIPELYGLTTPTRLDESIPYEVPVQTLHKPLSYNPQNTELNVSDMYAVVEKKRELHEHVNESDNHSDVIKKDLPSQLYFTLDQVSILLL